MNRILIAESGSGFGGSAKYLASLLPLIDSHKFDVDLVAYGSGPLIKEIENKSAQLFYRPSWRFPWREECRGGVTPPFTSEMAGRRNHALTASLVSNYISYALYLFFVILQITLLVPAIAFWLRRRKIRLVHLNNEILSHLPLLIAARLAGCQTLCHFHGWRNLTSMERWASRYVDQFIAVTQSGADFYSWQLKGKGVVGIPNGLAVPESEEGQDKSNIRCEMREKLGLQETNFLAILIGRLIPLKGHSVFFQALAKAKKKELGIRGLIVGNDPSFNGQYQKKLQSEIKALGIEDRITFLPWQDHMGPIYEASDVVVQPSIEPESFGYVALEGMAAAKPVIASRIGGLIDVIRDGETGFLVAPGNSDELSEAIIRIADHPQFGSELGKSGRERVKNVFTMTHNAQRVQELYDQLLNPSRILIAESGSGYGGTAKYLANLLPSIDQKAFSIQIAAYGEGPFIQEIEGKGWKVYRRKSWRYPWGEKEEIGGKGLIGNPFFNLAKYLFLAAIGFIQFTLLIPVISFWLKRKKIRVVHLNNGIRSHLPLLMASHFSGCRIICHFHGWRSFTHTEQWFTPWVDQFVAISEAGAEFLKDKIPRRNIIAIPNGLPAGHPLEKSIAGIKTDRAILGISESAKVISIVGRLVEWKGQEIYLKALARTIHDHPNVIGIILGHDPTPDQHYLIKLKALAEELQISSHIRFLPWQEDVKAIYSISDIVVHASTDPEPFGLVILEAMFARKPVVATRGGGVGDLVVDGKTGILVEPRNVDQFAHALHQLVSDPKFANCLAEAGENRAKTYFTMEQNAARVQDLYLDLLNNYQPRMDNAARTLKWRSGLKQAMFATGALRLVRKSLGFKVPVLMYHKISQEQDPFFPSVSEKTFRQQMTYIKQSYQIMSMDNLVKCLRSGENPPRRSIVVTFDDGNAPTLFLASSILKELDIPVTVFLSAEPTEENNFIWTDLLRLWFKFTKKNHYAIQMNGHVREWKLTEVQERLYAVQEISRKLKTMLNDERRKVMDELGHDLGVKRSELPNDWLLTGNQIKYMLKTNIKFGAHTMTHPILSRMSFKEARYEIFESKRWLENILNDKVRHFAYPNGESNDFTEEHENLVAQAGFDSGSSTIIGFNDSHANRYALRRIYATEESLANFASRLVGIGS